MQYRKFVLGAILCLWGIMGHSQRDNSATVSGTIKDETGNIIGFASVELKGTNYKAMSGPDGNYTLTAPPGHYVMLVSFVGYSTYQAGIVLNKDKILTHNLSLIKGHTNLGEVKIVGNTQAQELKESGFSINAIETRQFQNTTIDLNEILDKSTGVRVRRSGGFGSGYNFSINGLSGRAIKYFVDGIPMEIMGTSVDLNAIPVNLTNRIEVYKGVVPVEFGADAMGGVVNIVTNQSIRNYVDASYSYGSFNTHRGAVTAQYADDSTGIVVRASAYYNYSDNNYIMRGIEIWDPEKYEYVKKDLPRFHDKYESVLGQIEAGVRNRKWADGFFVGGSLSGYNKELQTAGSDLVLYGQAKQKGNAQSVFVKYRKDNLLVKDLNFNLFSSYAMDRYQVTDTTQYRYFWDQTKTEKSTAELGGEKTLNHIIRPRFFTRANLSYNLNDFTAFGLNYTLDDIENRNYNELREDKDYNPGRLSKHILGISWQQKLFDNKLQSNVFGKYYGMKLNQPVVNNTNGDRGSASAWTDNYGYGIGIRYLIRQHLGIKTSYEKAYRLQEVGEIFGNGITVLANPDLKPEHSENINLGFFAGYNKGRHRLELEASAFYRDAGNFIHSVIWEGHPERSRYLNTSNVRIKGAEAEIKYGYNKFFHAYVNMTWQHAINYTKYAVGSTMGRPEATYLNRIPNQPWLFGNAGFSLAKEDVLVKKSKLSLNWNLQYIHWFYLTWEAFGAPDGKSRIPNQILNDISLSYSLADGKYNVALDCKNITNALAYDNFRQQKPGSSYSIKVRYFLTSFNQFNK